MNAQANKDRCVNKPSPNLKVHAGYKKYNDYNKIYCLDSQNCLLAVQALGKYKIRFTMPQYNYSEIMLLSLETALDNLEKGGGKVLLEEIEL
jgi:hypothetical protein